MREFTTPGIETEKFQTGDEIATTPEQEETTVSPMEPSIKNDPYENDKW